MSLLRQYIFWFVTMRRKLSVDILSSLFSRHNWSVVWAASWMARSPIKRSFWYNFRPKYQKELYVALTLNILAHTPTFAQLTMKNNNITRWTKRKRRKSQNQTHKLSRMYILFLRSSVGLDCELGHWFSREYSPLII